MKTAIRLIALAALLSGTFFVSSTLACTTTAWSGATVGTLADDPTNGVPRVSGLCGLEVTGTGYVVDNNPAAETKFIGRFYVYPKLLAAGTHTIFTAYSDEAGTKLFEIAYDGSDFTFDASSATGGGSTSVVADTTHWNLIEFVWESGAQGSFWVNTDALSADANSTFASGTGAVEQIRLGTESGVGGTAYFDDYESHRSSPVGGLLAGDANNDASINILDVGVITSEILLRGLGDGQPDCNLDGSINILDVGCATNIILSAP